MAYRILADENVERATVNYLRKLGHNVEQLDEVSELGLGIEDESIARYAREHDRLILTQDDDFFTELAVERTAGVLFKRIRLCPHAKSGMSSTRCHAISNSPTSPSSTSAETGCDETVYPRRDAAFHSVVQTTLSTHFSHPSVRGRGGGCQALTSQQSVLNAVTAEKENGLEWSGSGRNGRSERSLHSKRPRLFNERCTLFSR